MKGETSSERKRRRAAATLAGVTIDTDDLAHLQEQLAFIDASCANFDEGFTAEAKRLAMAVRILVRDNQQGLSLLSRMGVRDVLAWSDGTIPQGPTRVRIVKEKGGTPVGCLLAVTDNSVGWLPSFTRHPLDRVLVRFAYWWEKPRLHDSHGTEASRRDVVLWLAHHDGGAHVSDLPDDYARIARRGSVAMLLSEGVHETSPIPAAMRQIAEEVRVTLRASLGELVDLELPRAHPRGRRVRAAVERSERSVG